MTPCSSQREDGQENEGQDAAQDQDHRPVEMSEQQCHNRSGCQPKPPMGAPVKVTMIIVARRRCGVIIAGQAAAPENPPPMPMPVLTKRQRPSIPIEPGCGAEAARRPRIS